MTVQQENSGTAPVRDAHRFDETSLVHWLESNVQSFAGPLKVEQFKGGQSNPTYKLVTLTKNYVLRRKPPGSLVQGAHAIEREVRVSRALERLRFPVAHVYALCTDEHVIGTWFYVMEMVEGRIFWDATLPDMAKADRAGIYDAMNGTLATLHQIDPVVAGLEDYGRSGNYFERQIARWSRQYLGDEMAGRDTSMDLVMEWLKTNIPASDDTRLVHGDFRIDNLIFHPTEPRIIAVLDWELSTLGHPVADFSYNVMAYHMPPDIVAGLGNVDPAELGIPTEEEYVAAYCRRTGRDSIPDYKFYMAFNFFRLAAIAHGVKGRVARGTAASSHAQSRAETFPRLASLAWQWAQAAAPNDRSRVYATGIEKN